MIAIPNRHGLALDPAEEMAESADRAARLLAIARETGNWPVLGALKSIKLHEEERRRKKSCKDAGKQTVKSG